MMVVRHLKQRGSIMKCDLSKWDITTISNHHLSKHTYNICGNYEGLDIFLSFHVDKQSHQTATWRKFKSVLWQSMWASSRSEELWKCIRARKALRPYTSFCRQKWWAVWVLSSQLLNPKFKFLLPRCDITL